MKLVGPKLLSSLIFFGHLGSARGFHLGSRIRTLGKSSFVNTPFLDSKQSIITRRMAAVPTESTAISSVNEAQRHNFTWQQTMLRIKDPKLSLPFYEDMFGFKLVHFYNFPQWNFSLYFLAFIPDEEKFDLIPGSPESEKYLWSTKSEINFLLCDHLITCLTC
jgi:hypothetical protein